MNIDDFKKVKNKYRIIQRNNRFYCQVNVKSFFIFNHWKDIDSMAFESIEKAISHVTIYIQHFIKMKTKTNEQVVWVPYGEGKF